MPEIMKLVCAARNPPGPARHTVPVLLREGRCSGKKKGRGSVDEAIRKQGGFTYIGRGEKHSAINQFSHRGYRQVGRRIGSPGTLACQPANRQHSDRNCKGKLVELLQRGTSWQIILTRDRKRGEAKCLHVIPPMKVLPILHGALHLLAPLAPHGLHLPIGLFIPLEMQDQAGK